MLEIITSLDQKTTEIITTILFNLIVEIGIFSLIIFVYFYQKRFLVIYIIVGIFLELWLFGRGNILTTPRSNLKMPENKIEKNLERVVSSSDVFDYIGPHVYWNHLRVRQPFAPDLTDSEIKDFKRLKNEIKMLPGNLNMFQNLYSASGYSAVVLKNYADYWQSTEVNSVAIKNINDSRLKTMGVTTIISGYPQDFIKNENGFNINYFDSNISFYKQNANKRAFLLNSGTLNLDLYSPNRIKLSVDSWEENQVVLTDAYYPGWIALVDGKESIIKPFDGVFRQVNISPGFHTVEFLYKPKSVRIGGWISLLTVSLILLINLYEKIRSKKHS